MNISVPDSGILFECEFENLPTKIGKKLYKRLQPYIYPNKTRNKLCIHVTDQDTSKQAYCNLVPSVTEQGDDLFISQYGLFSGKICFKSPQCIGRFSCAPDEKYIFQVIRVFALVQFIKHGGIPVHASAIFYKNKGIVFYGNQGDGKSTISKLSNVVIIADDTVLLKRIRGTYVIFSTPFDYKISNSKPKIAALSMCIRTSHVRQNDTLLKFKDKLAITEFLTYVRPDMSFFQHSPYFLRNIFSSVVMFTRQFNNFYTLDFSYSKKFLQLIDASQRVH